jgi:hypothetical protein
VPSTFKITDLISSEAERLVVAFRQKLVGHPGEFGKGREEIVREFLRLQLPKKFSVSSGFVFDVHGHISQQADVIIYDSQECPIFTAAGGVSFFPCEGVVAAGQVKSRITSKAEYESALQNLRSIKSLDRSAGATSISVGSGEPIVAENHLHQIFTFLFVIDKCLRTGPLTKALYEHLWKNQRSFWPNITYAFDQYFLTLCCHGGICPNPMDAFGISIVKGVPNSELLLWFSRLLTQAVAVTHVATFSYHRYLHGDKPRPWTCYGFEYAPVNGPIPEHLLEVRIPNWWQPNVVAPDVWNE